LHYPILCSDLDGTLLSTKNDVSDFCIDQIDRIKDNTKVILVSARMPKAMVYLQERLGILGNPIICYNGALIMKGATVISTTVIPLKQLQELYTIAKKLNVDLGLYFKDEWYVPRDSLRVQKEIYNTKALPVIQETQITLSDWNKRDIGAHKIMLMGTKEAMDILALQFQKTFTEKLQWYRSNDTLIEVAPKQVSKLSAIEVLLSENQSLRDVIAFGDNYNDLEMLQRVGCGVAVANGREEVKAIADYIALKNTEDGVAQFIEQHL